MSVTLLLQDVKDNKAEAASAAPQALRLCQMVGLTASPAQSQMCYSCSYHHDCNWTADLCSQRNVPNLSVALCCNSVAGQMHVSLEVMLVELLGCMPAIDANAAVFNRRHGLIVMHTSQKDDFIIYVKPESCCFVFEAWFTASFRPIPSKHVDLVTCFEGFARLGTGLHYRHNGKG